MDMGDSPVLSSRLSPPKLLWGIVRHPAQTFTYLKDMGKRGVWIAAVLIVLLSLLPLVSAGTNSTAPAMTTVMSSTDLPPDAMMMDPGPLPAAPSGPGIFKLVGVVLGTLLTWLIWGGGLYLASVFLGRSNSFKQMLKLTVWAWIPYAFRGILQTLYVLVSRTPILNAGLSGFVIDKGAQQLIPPGPGDLSLASVLGHVDLFQIWTILLLGTGLTAFTGIPLKKARITTLIIWALLILVTMVTAIVGGMFSQAASIF